MPQYANQNWYNAHNFYGDLNDIEAAKLDEVQAFFRTYYAPNNAALAVVGDFDPAEAKAMVAKYFGAIPKAEVPPLPDLAEPGSRKRRWCLIRTRWPIALPWRSLITCRRATRLNTMPWGCWTRCSAGRRQPAKPGVGEETGLRRRVSGASIPNLATCSIIPALCCGPHR